MSLNQLNYHHLMYFWVTAQEGSIQAAADRLRLAHPTVSGQLKQFESNIGHKLLRREGRRLVVTEAGQVVMRYADTIFQSGLELQEQLRLGNLAELRRLAIGVTDAMPKFVVRRFLQPIFGDANIRLICEEGNEEELFAGLVTHRFDLVLSDTKAPKKLAVKVHHQPLGDSEVVFMAPESQAESLAQNFPQCLNGAPLVLPTRASTLRRSLEEWFSRNHLVPKIVAEVADSALIKVLGSEGLGLFAIPALTLEEVRKFFHSEPIGTADGIRENFFAITSYSGSTHPAVKAICEAAKALLDESRPRPPLQG